MPRYLESYNGSTSLSNEQCNMLLALTLDTNHRSKNRLLLTSTPLQNNLTELWALLNFFLPTVFSNSEAFEQLFNSHSKWHVQIATNRPACHQPSPSSVATVHASTSEGWFWLSITGKGWEGAQVREKSGSLGFASNWRASRISDWNPRSKYLPRAIFVPCRAKLERIVHKSQESDDITNLVHTRNLRQPFHEYRKWQFSVLCQLGSMCVPGNC